MRKNEISKMESIYGNYINIMDNISDSMRDINRRLNHADLLDFDEYLILKKEHFINKLNYYSFKRAARRIEKKLNKEELVYSYSPRR